MKKSQKIKYWCYLTIVGFGLFTGCIYKRDVSSSASKYTDYVIGQTYELKQHVFLHKFDKEDKQEIPTLKLLGANGTASDAAGFSRDESSNPQVLGLLLPRQKLRVFKILESKSPNMGPFLHVHARLIEGAFNDQTVDLFMISTRDLIKNRTTIDTNIISLQE